MTNLLNQTIFAELTEGTHKLKLVKYEIITAKTELKTQYLQLTLEDEQGNKYQRAIFENELTLLMGQLQHQVYGSASNGTILTLLQNLTKEGTFFNLYVRNTIARNKQGILKSYVNISFKHPKPIEQKEDKQKETLLNRLMGEVAK